MANVYKNLASTVGNTPLVELSGYAKHAGLCARLLAKLEGFNPAGSSKDRVALSMISAAEEAGVLKPGSVIIEPTSGNTGIALAAFGVSRGYRVVMVIPSTASVERQKLIAAYGAEVVLTDGALGMQGAIARAQELAETTEHGFIASQFTNPATPAAHYAATGPEIWRDTDGLVDVFVCGIGTGGTVSGTAKYLKEQDSNIKVVGVEPFDSAVLSGGKAGPHALQGIGAGFVPETLDTALLDEVLTATKEESYLAARTLAHTDGILAGISSGAALSAAARIASREENRGKTVVVLLPDTGERYLSTDLF